MYRFAKPGKDRKRSEKRSNRRRLPLYNRGHEVQLPADNKRLANTKSEVGVIEDFKKLQLRNISDNDDDFDAIDTFAFNNEDIEDFDHDIESYMSEFFCEDNHNNKQSVATTSNIEDVKNAVVAIGFMAHCESVLGGKKNKTASMTALVRVATILSLTYQCVNGSPLDGDGVPAWIATLISREFASMESCCDILLGPEYHLSPTTIMNYMDALSKFIRFWMYFRRKDEQENVRSYYYYYY